MAAAADGAPPSRWLAVRHALAYVAGFGAVFTLLGVTATFVGRPARRLPARPCGSIGGLDPHRPGPEPRRHPADPGPRADLAAAGRGRRRRPWRPATGLDRASAAPAPARPGRRRPPGRPDRRRRGAAGSRRSGSVPIFAIGWTPCIGIILGGILTHGGDVRHHRSRARILLVAYTLGLGLPFIADRRRLRPGAGASSRPLVRHGRAVSLIGGLLVVVIGARDGLRLARRCCPRYFNFSRRSEVTERPGVHPPAGAARPHRPVQRPPARWRSSSIVVVAVVVLVAVDDPARRRRAEARRRSTRGPTPYVIGSAPPEGLRPGDLAPELAVAARRRVDLPADRPRRPARSASPTCAARPSGSTSGPAGARPARPRRRSCARWPSATATAGLEVVAISVQETSPDDVQAYAERYELDYTIGFDALRATSSATTGSTACRPSSSSTRTASSASSSRAR